MRSLGIPCLCLAFCVARTAEIGQTAQTWHTFNANSILLPFSDSLGSLVWDRKVNEVWARGESWKRSEWDLGDDRIQLVESHPFDRRSAFVVTSGSRHFRTDDGGQTWQSFETIADLKHEVDRGNKVFAFNSQRPDFGILFGANCTDKEINCCRNAYFTTDGFKEINLLKTNVQDCIFAHSDSNFERLPFFRIYCTAYKGPLCQREPRGLNMDLIVTDSFGERWDLVDFNGKLDTAEGGVHAISVVQNFLLAAAIPRANEDEDLYVTRDGELWRSAIFPKDAKFEERGYTVLPSMKNRLMVVLAIGSEKDQRGEMVLSDSEGEYFTILRDRVFRGARGEVEFAQVQPFELGALLLLNTVHQGARKSIISWDGGQSWNEIAPPEDMARVTCNNYVPGLGGQLSCSLHFHLYLGGLASSHASPHAPGILLGVGNVGEELRDLSFSDTFISLDGGWTWDLAQKGPHLYAIAGFGSVIALIPYGEKTDFVLLSTDGKNFEKLPMRPEFEGQKVGTFEFVPKSITATNGGKDPGFVISGDILIDGRGPFFVLLTLDLRNAFERSCDANDEDTEVFSLKAKPDGGQSCVGGHSTEYLRRKPVADCLAGDNLNMERQQKPCPCKADDFECGPGFAPDADGRSCVIIGRDPDAPDDCPLGTYYTSTTGYRKIRENDCEGGVDQTGTLRRLCDSAGVRPPGDSTITTTVTELPAEVKKELVFAGTESLMVLLGDLSVWLSTDGGKTWSKKLDGCLLMAPHEHDPKQAIVIIGERLKITQDAGKTWRDANIPIPPNNLRVREVDFHPRHWDWMLFTGTPRNTRHTETYLSRDGGYTFKFVDDHTGKCVFRQDRGFLTGADDDIYCVSYKGQGEAALVGPQSSQKGRLNLYKKGNTAAATVLKTDVVDFAVLSGYLAVAVRRGPDIRLFTSRDGERLMEAKMNGDHGSLALLETTSGRMVIIRQSKGDLAARLLGSDKEGVSFSTLLHDLHAGSAAGGRNAFDFMELEGLHGIHLANTVKYEGGGRTLRTVVTYEDGGSWTRLKWREAKDATRKVICDRDCFLNLHGKTSDIGGFLTSRSVPGLIMAVGNVGPSLKEYTRCDTFLSRDAGHTWVKVRDEAHHLAVLDNGGILVLVDNESYTNVLHYSFDYGKTWVSHRLNEYRVKVQKLVSDPNSPTRSMAIFGKLRHPRTAGSGESQETWVVIRVDFTQAQLRQCTVGTEGDLDNDFELWSPVDGDGQKCVLGRRFSYWRRKSDHVDCYLGDFDAGKTAEEAQCACDDDDYECDYGYERSEDGSCHPVAGFVDPDKPPDCGVGKTYMGSSGFRKVPVSSCIGGVDMTQRIERMCDGSRRAQHPAKPPPENGGIRATITVLDERMANFHFFEDSEVVLMLDLKSQVWRSGDEGETWHRVGGIRAAASMQRNPSMPSRIYFLDPDMISIWYSVDSGQTIRKMTLPGHPRINRDSAGAILNFHNMEPDWIIFTANNSNPDTNEGMAYFSVDHGETWHGLGSSVQRCEWAHQGAFSSLSRTAVFCLKITNNYKTNSKQLDLVVSDDFFVKKEKTLVSDISAFAIQEGYVVVNFVKSSTLLLATSRDGENFVTAHFLPALRRPDPTMYTVVSSHSGNMFVDVAINRKRGREYGALYQSNFLGEKFTLSIGNTNRNTRFVDFGALQGIPGTSIVNTVANPDSADKRIKTFITFDDGGLWHQLSPPEADANGNLLQGGKLHLHGYIESNDPQNLFDIAGAPGLFMGVGNVGDYLTDYKNGDVYLTRDGGKTWRQIRKGPHAYEFGNYGTILVLVDDARPTDKVVYSFDGGVSWHEFVFSDEKIRVTIITTQPRSRSQEFLMFGDRGRDGKQVAVHLDFARARTRQCDLKHDFERWKPHDSCVLGERLEFLRLKSTHGNCFIEGDIGKPVDLGEPCECTSEDFACDYGYRRNFFGTACDEIDPVWKTQCTPGETTPAPSGFRKIPSTKCQGGLDLVNQTVDRLCPAPSASMGGGRMLLTFLVVVVVLCVVAAWFAGVRTLPITSSSVRGLRATAGEALRGAVSWLESLSVVGTLRRLQGYRYTQLNPWGFDADDVLESDNDDDV